MWIPLQRGNDRPNFGEKVLIFIQNINSHGEYYCSHEIAYYCKYIKNRNYGVFVDVKSYENKYKIRNNKGEDIIVNPNLTSAPDSKVYQYTTHWQYIEENPERIKKRIQPKLFF